MFHLKHSIIYLFLCLLWSCKTTSDPNEDLSVKEEENVLVWKRFDKDFFSINKGNLDMESERLKEEYGELYKVYIERILNFGLVDDPALDLYLSNFFNDIAVQKLYSDVSESFEDLDEEKKKINFAFQRYMQLFKNRNLPKVTTFVSGFPYYQGNIFPKKVFITDQYLALGIDMYLGQEYTAYTAYGFPLYFRKTMEREYMVPDLIRGWMFTEFPFQSESVDLVSRMMNEGKIAYIIEKLLPTTPEHLQYGFTKEELIWCRANEEMMWTTLINKKLLYEKNPAIVDAYFLEGPFTKDFPKESPARAIVWLAKQIISSYVKKEGVKAEDLMKEQDLKNIFNNSGYKP